MTMLNIYEIENQEKIKIKYRLFRVRGLVPQSEEYEKNAQLLSDRLSRMTKSPCALVKEGEQLFIAQPEGFPALPDRVDLIRATAIIEPNAMERDLDYSCLQESDAHLAIRLLQFHLDGQLHEIPTLWRPSPGMPYFQKDPDPRFRSHEAVMYRGFRMKLVLLPRNRIGVCIDVTRKYASKHYLPSKITPDEFRRKYKGKKCVYEFGNRWYEIRLDNISGLNVIEEMMPDGISLFDYIHRKTRGLKPKALMTLPKDCTVLTYETALGVIKRVPSALCRLTYSTDHPLISEHHSKTIMPPGARRNDIEFAVRKYLDGWKFQGIPIMLSDKMLEVDCDVLECPDLEFGGGKVLSLARRAGAINTTLEELGQTKRRLLYSTDAGFFVKKPLDRQYLILPKSMYDTFGPRYIEDLKAQFKALYSPSGEFEYDPTIITYNDAVQQSIYTLGNEILQSTFQSIQGFWYSGYGLVVIPRFEPRRPDREDELANLLLREFRKRGIYVSISHTEIPSKSYVAVTLANGEVVWQVVNDERRAKRFRGYLENVVLNKILLLNSSWPFVLSKPLHTDFVIGLDVKNNTAGFMLVFKDGKTFSFLTSDSDQKEQLSKGHVATKIYNILKQELESDGRKIHDITVHRDGKLYAGEMKGIKEALDRLAKEGLIEKDYNCNFLEIRKTSRTPVRFFDIKTPQGFMREVTENPRIGTYIIFGDTAYMCTTGRPFRYQGTTRPLLVRKRDGNMDFKLILEDVFALANLTWTKPDYCSRVPITIRMNDIRLREFAGEYDEDRLKFLEEEWEE